MLIGLGVAFIVGVLIALAALCGLPQRENPYFTETGEPVSW